MMIMMMSITIFFTIHSMLLHAKCYSRCWGIALILSSGRDIINIINSKQLLFTKDLLCSNKF